ncbi:MAG: M3 family metallopeptidase [Pseudonocardia sp.]
MNPFAEPSPLPFGYPPLDVIREEHFRPAFTEAMATHRAEVDAITANPEPATFANTVEALERSGTMLRRVSAVFFTLVSSASTPGIRAIEAEVSPQLAAHRDAIALDPALVARLDDLHARRHELALDAESLRLLEERHRDVVRAGALLDPAGQQRLRALNAELSTLSSEFGNRLLAEANDSAVLVRDPARLDGLPADAVAAAARAATERGHDGAWLLPMVLPTGQPVLASLTDRSLREEIHRASTARNSRGGDHDTREIVRRTTALRAERAALLGHPHHASWIAEDSTAATTDRIDDLLARLVAPAVRNARIEDEELAAVAGHPVEAWDRAFYAERVRRARFDVDAEVLRPFLELERVLHDGVFFAANRLYGLEFTERHDLPTHHPDVRVFDVTDADGEPLGLFVADHFARASKRGGAWMNSFVSQSRLLGTRPVVLNTLNLNRPAVTSDPPTPVLLTLDEVRTMFHEFGHALHGLLSDVTYPSFSGTSVPRDFVEFPSQVNEMWMVHPEVLAHFARHHDTGEPIPDDLVAKLEESRHFGEGFATTEYLAAALLDQAWHRLAPDAQVDDVERFEAAALAAAGCGNDTVPTAPPRYRSAYFNHVFGGGYSAGYYSYIWAEVLDADAVEWFAERGGLRRENGERFRRELLSRGGSVDPMAAYRAFRGRDPRIEPLLVRRGLA